MKRNSCWWINDMYITLLFKNFKLLYYKIIKYFKSILKINFLLVIQAIFLLTFYNWNWIIYAKFNWISSFRKITWLYIFLNIVISFITFTTIQYKKRIECTKQLIWMNNKHKYGDWMDCLLFDNILRRLTPRVLHRFIGERNVVHGNYSSIYYTVIFSKWWPMEASLPI